MSKSLKPIIPTIGRRLWYIPSIYDLGGMLEKPTTIIEASSSQPCDAGVVFVHGDRLVNLSVTDHDGNVHKRTSVTLVQPGDTPPVGVGFCKWMDYQVTTANEEPKLTGSRPTTVTIDDPATDAAIEAAIVAKGLTAARVTPDDIDELMTRVVYTGEVAPGTTSTFIHAFLDGTFYLASGHSACVSPENFDAAIGAQIAKGNAQTKAREKLWELEGYALFKRKATTPLFNVEDGEPVFNTEDPDHAEA
jgi:hypothetical protein